MRYNVLGAFNPITHEVITETNDTYINQVVFCQFLEKIAKSYQGTGLPITLVLDNARYQKGQSVFAKAAQLGIELLYLPAYLPYLNLIERLWRFVKKEVLYRRYYQTFVSFKDCLSELTTRFKNDMISLMTRRCCRNKIKKKPAWRIEVIKLNRTRIRQTECCHTIKNNTTYKSFNNLVFK